jgi:hypothetical protein
MREVKIFGKGTDKPNLTAHNNFFLTFGVIFTKKEVYNHGILNRFSLILYTQYHL